MKEKRKGGRKKRKLYYLFVNNIIDNSFGFFLFRLFWVAYRRFSRGYFYIRVFRSFLFIVKS